MRIGVSGYFMNNRSVGIGVYTSQLLRSLARVDKSHQYLTFVPEGNDFETDSFPANFVFSKHAHVPFGNPMIKRVLWEMSLSFKIRKHDLELFHFPFFSSCWTPGIKTVVTIHDVAHCRFPIYKGRLIGKLYFNYLARAMIKADHIITDSEHSRLEILEFVGIPDTKISVIPLAADALFVPVKDENKLDQVREKYNLPDKFIFYIGGFDVRKNVDNLLKAYASLKKAGKIEHKLVLGGKVPDNQQLILKGAVIDMTKLIQELGIIREVCLPGFIEAQDLPSVYSLAELFVFPSLYEGFGLPVLEAMSCGTPVIASARSSLPEIIQREDLLFDPEDITRIKESMMAVLTDETMRISVSRWGRERATAFSWKMTALETRKVYEGILSS